MKGNLPEAMYLGLIVNPRNGVLCEVVGLKDSDRSTHIYLPDASKIGSGYFETDEESRYYLPTAITGYPRSHTPRGVSIKRSGFGTTLYTGLCLRAHLSHEGVYPLRIEDADGNGISSHTDSRSGEADSWWASAHDLGLVESIKGTSTKETVFEEECSPKIESLIASYNDFSIITNCNVSGEAETEKSATVDIYKADSAFNHGLIISCTRKRTIYKYNSDTCFAAIDSSEDIEGSPDYYSHLSLEAILALNTGIYGKTHWNTVRNIVMLAKMAGASMSQIQRLTDRYEAGIDIEAEGEDADLTERAAQKPKPKPKSKQETKTNPRAKSIYRPVYYGTARNPPDKGVRKNIEELAERRASLGWDKLSELP